MGKFVKTRKLALLATTTLCLLGRARRRKSLKSCWVRSWLSRRERHGMSTTLVRELETEDTAEYRSMFRMNKDCFELLLQMISQSIVKQDTRMRQSVSPKERLQVTLRYLATGRVAYRLHDFLHVHVTCTVWPTGGTKVEPMLRVFHLSVCLSSVCLSHILVLGRVNIPETMVVFI